MSLGTIAQDEFDAATEQAREDRADQRERDTEAAFSAIRREELLIRFAAAALTGELAQPDEGRYAETHFRVLAERCFDMADAMLAELERRTKERK